MTDRELLKEARDRLHGFAEPFPTNWSTPEAIFALLDRIDAALAAPVSTGPLVTVPREPTEAMIDAGAATPLCKAIDDCLTNHAIRTGVSVLPLATTETCALAEIYRAMIAAAPPAGDDARDAARYRWLRGATWLVLKIERIKWVRPDGSEFYSSHFLQANGMQCAAAPTLDETIDAAMRAQGESK